MNRESDFKSVSGPTAPRTRLDGILLLATLLITHLAALAQNVVYDDQAIGSPYQPPFNGEFGDSLSVSGDTVAIGCNRFEGPSALIYRRDPSSGQWTYDTELLLDVFARNESLALDGDGLIFGLPEPYSPSGPGVAYIFGYDRWSRAPGRSS
jgi:hypothetical protein